MSNMEHKCPQCGCEAPVKWPTPGRIAKMTWEQFKATCYPEGLLVRVIDGPAPGLYVTLNGQPQRIITEVNLCDLVKETVAELQSEGASQ